MNKTILNINNLSVNVEDKKILSKFSLNIKNQEIHAIMGPNGSGKSTLAYTIMGHPKYHVTNGKIIFKNKNILNLTSDKISRLGVFLSFQTPLEISGLNYFSFLKNSYTSTHNNKITALKFNELVKEKTKLINIDDSFLSRDLNVGFSGGEKKRAEILQMNLLNFL
jgi:Fe-S cluster assembly ATP-binding protein